MGNLRPYPGRAGLFAQPSRSGAIAGGSVSPAGPQGVRGRHSACFSRIPPNRDRLGISAQILATDSAAGDYRGLGSRRPRRSRGRGEGSGHERNFHASAEQRHLPEGAAARAALPEPDQNRQHRASARNPPAAPGAKATIVGARLVRPKGGATGVLNRCSLRSSNRITASTPKAASISSRAGASSSLPACSLAASRRGEKPDKQDVLAKPKTAKAPSNRIGPPRKQVLKPRFKASAISSRGNRARTRWDEFYGSSTAQGRSELEPFPFGRTPGRRAGSDCRPPTTLPDQTRRRRAPRGPPAVGGRRTSLA